MRDEFATDPAKATKGAKVDIMQRQSDERPSAETDFQYGPELPEIDAVEFSFVFDYSDDDSRYFVLYGKQVILSGPAANDPEDCITDNSLGGQFIEIVAGRIPLDLVSYHKGIDRHTLRSVRDGRSARTEVLVALMELKKLWINAEQCGALESARDVIRSARRGYTNGGGLRDLMLREKKAKQPF